MNLQMGVTPLACAISMTVGGLVHCSSSTVIYVAGDAGEDSATDLDSGPTDDSATGDAAEASSSFACDPGTKMGAVTGGTLTSKEGVGISVRTPKGYDPTVPAPFIMVYSPAGGDKTITEEFTGLTPPATARGYVIAYADEVTPSGIAAVQQASGTIPAVTAKWCIDPKRIYATGHSNGGTIDEVMASKSFVTLAAVAPSAAGIDATDFANLGCPKSPLPEIELHSSGDQLFPLAQGFGADVAKGWAKCDGCGATPSAPRPDGCIKYTGCSSGVEVQYCQGTLPHGYWPPLANTTILDFFDRFTAP